MKKTVIFFILLFMSAVFAQQAKMLERVYEGSSKNKNPLVAKKEILNEAIDKVSEALIKEIIGEAKFNRNKSIILQKIIKNSARFIPLSIPGALKGAEENYQMSVSLKVSISDLQAMLLENGLFYESDSTPIVMPLVRWSDKVNLKNYNWWMDGDSISKAFLQKENRQFESTLKVAFAKNQFYVIRPLGLKYEEILSSILKSERPSIDDWSFLSHKLGVQIVVDGDVQILKSQERSEASVIEIRLSALQVMNGRSIAEVSRQYETDVGPIEVSIDKKMREVLEQTSQDLASQVFDAWSRGAIGSSLYKLTVKGRIPLSLQEAFKETIKNKVREIKNIKERLISSEDLVFELDSSLPPKDLALRLKEFEVPPYKFIYDSSSDAEIVYLMKRSETR